MVRAICPGSGDGVPCSNVVERPIGLDRKPARCPRCEARSRARSNSRRRPGRTEHEIQRRKDAVDSHIEVCGYWCPGVPELEREPHPVRPPLRLSADHVADVSALIASGVPPAVAEAGPLQVICTACNAARHNAGLGRSIAE